MYRNSKNLFAKDLFKIFTLNSATLIARLFTGLIITKVSALFIGVSGLGVLGLVRNFITLLDSILLLGTKNGIISHLSSSKDKSKNIAYISSLFWFFLTISITICGVMLILKPQINHYFFSNKISSVFIYLLFVFSIPFQAMSILFGSILNGLRKYKTLSIVSILSSILSLLVTIVLILKFNITGAIISIFISSILVFIVTLYFFKKEYSLLKIIQLSPINLKLLLPLLKFSIMTLVVSFLSTALANYIRVEIVSKFSIEYAGYYEAILRISTLYMTFVSSLISFYYLPEISKCINQSQVNSIIKSYLRSFTPIFIMLMGILLLTSDWLIKLFYTKEFLVIVPYLKYQIIIDILKSIFMIVGMQFFAFGNLKGFLFTEFISMGFQFLFFYFGIKIIGFEAVWISQILSSLIYLFTLIMYFKKNPLQKNEKSISYE